MAFRDLRDIIGPLQLPIGGKLYTLPVVSAEDGTRIRLATETAKVGQPDAIPAAELDRIILGDVRAEMEADKLRPDEIDRVFWTGLADVQRGRAVAEIIWEQGVDPKAIEAAREAALKTQNRATRRKTRTAAASTTPRRASTSGTKTQPK